MLIPILIRSVITLVRSNKRERPTGRPAYFSSVEEGERTIFFFGGADKLRCMCIIRHIEDTVCSIFFRDINPEFKDKNMIRMILKGVMHDVDSTSGFRIAIEREHVNVTLLNVLFELGFYPNVDVIKCETEEGIKHFVAIYKAPIHDIDNPPLFIKIKTLCKKYLKKVYQF